MHVHYSQFQRSTFALNTGDVMKLVPFNGARTSCITTDMNSPPTQVPVPCKRGHTNEINPRTLRKALTHHFIAYFAPGRSLPRRRRYTELNFDGYSVNGIYIATAPNILFPFHEL